MTWANKSRRPVGAAAKKKHKNRILCIASDAPGKEDFSDRLPVYDGCLTVGYIEKQGPHSWAVFTALNGPLGVFANLPQALRAIPPTSSVKKRRAR